MVNCLGAPVQNLAFFLSVVLKLKVHIDRSSLVAQWSRIHLPMWETQVQSLGQKDPLEKEMATHYSILAWKVPWTEEPGGLYSPWGHKVGHDSACTQDILGKYKQQTS